MPRAAALLILLSALAPAQERVALTAKDGQPLVATVARPTGTPKGGVVMLHMAGSSRGVWQAILPRLTQAGWIAVALDMRGHGDSTKDARGNVVAVGRETTSRPESNPFAAMWQDADAAFDYCVAQGAPPERLAVIGAAAGCAVALDLAARSPTRPKALVLMTPVASAPGMDSLAHAKAMQARPVLLLSAEDEAAAGAKPLKALMPYEEAEVRLFPGVGINGTNMFGKVAGVDGTIVLWIEGALDAAPRIDIPSARTISVDGEITPSELSGRALLKLPLIGALGAPPAIVRVSHTDTVLDLAFDIPERYLRLNEVAVYIDVSGKGPRAVDASCLRVSYSPKNKARKAIMVQQGGAAGWVDAEDKGVKAFARTEEPARWTAEISLDLARFVPAGKTHGFRMALQVTGQRATDLRFVPPVAIVPDTPRIWAPCTLQ